MCKEKITVALVFRGAFSKSEKEQILDRWGTFYFLKGVFTARFIVTVKPHGLYSIFDIETVQSYAFLSEGETREFINKMTARKRRG